MSRTIIGIDTPQCHIQLFEERSIGQKIREAREFGVFPDMPMNEGAFDDQPEEQDVVDPLCNPRTDPLDYIDYLNSKVSDPEPSPSSDPAPSADPAPSSDPAPSAE